MTVQMVEADVTSSAADIQSAADQVGALKPGDRLTAVSTALPGSQSAGKAGSLATEWADDLARWKQKAIAQHDAMIAASSGITEADVWVQNRLGGI
jgi:hypothetical protein